MTLDFVFNIKIPFAINRMEYLARFSKNVALSATSCAAYEILLTGFGGEFKGFHADRVELKQVAIAGGTGAGVGAAISFITILFDYITTEPNMYYKSP